MAEAEKEILGRTEKAKIDKKGTERERLYLLDTTALLAFIEDEKGADEVEKVLREAYINKARVLASFMSIMEGYHCLLKKGNEEGARDFYLYMKVLPVEIIGVDEKLIIKAGEIKTNFPLTTAESWVVASAMEYKAILVHKEPSYEVLSSLIPMVTLPY
jgi:ribonuclease VapC